MSHARPRRRIALTALTVVMALVLTSCFGGEEDAAESTTTTATQAPPTATTQAPPPQTVTTTQAPPPTSATVAFEAPPPPEPPQPPPAPPEEPAVNDEGILIYTVQAGDTLFSVAQRFGVSLDDIIEANNISNPDVIFEGDTLTIPPAG